MAKRKIKLRRGERGKIEIVQADPSGRSDLLGKVFSLYETGGAEFVSLRKAARTRIKAVRETEAHWEREYQLAKEAEKRKHERQERGGSRRRWR